MHNGAHFSAAWLHAEPSEDVRYICCCVPPDSFQQQLWSLFVQEPSWGSKYAKSQKQNEQVPIIPVFAACLCKRISFNILLNSRLEII